VGAKHGCQTFAQPLRFPFPIAQAAQGRGVDSQAVAVARGIAHPEGYAESEAIPHARGETVGPAVANSCPGSCRFTIAGADAASHSSPNALAFTQPQRDAEAEIERLVLDLRPSPAEGHAVTLRFRVAAFPQAEALPEPG